MRWTALTPLLFVVCLLGAGLTVEGAAPAHAARLDAPALQRALHALPPLAIRGVRVQALHRHATTAQVVFSSDFLPLIDDDILLEETLHRLSQLLHPLTDVEVFVQTSHGVLPLSDLVPPAPVPEDFVSPPPSSVPPLRGEPDRSQFPFVGPLTGKRIAVSPGHGWYWVASLSGWHTQRALLYGMIEDMGNWRMASHVIQALEQTGAAVFSCRERDRNTREFIVDDTSPHYQDGAGWATSTYTGYAGGYYRYRNTVTNATGLVPARWTPPFAQEGDYAVYVFYRAGTNRASDARYLIRHAGGESVVRLDQTQNDRRWVYIGTYRFTTDKPGQGLELWPESATGGVVIADAVKFGGGMGSLARGGSTSGKPRWEEAARYWVEFVGAPGWAYRSDLADDAGDVTTRPLYTNWQGADLSLSLHTNAFNGEARGTETYMYNGDAPAGSQTWRNLVHQRMLHAIRTEWLPNWNDRGLKSANFGELRELSGIPGCLTEVAFHDNAYDASYLRRPPFRATVARSVAKAALEYFDANLPLFPPPVRNIRVIPPRPGVLRVLWEPRADPSFPEALPTSYRIYLSRGLDGYDNGTVTTTNTYWDLTDWEPGELLAFRVAARNAGGESVKSEPVVARVWPNRFPQILIVNGFDRQDRSIQEEDNTGDYALVHARALSDAGDYGFVSSSNEAVALGLVDLPLFAMVDWIAGEEARLSGEVAAFTSLSADERAALRAYTEGGGNLMISGSEIGWDVVDSGQSDQAYKDFYREVLRASYVADNAKTYQFSGTSGGWFEGVSGSFDDGSHGRYNVDWPEVIAAASGSELCMVYPDSRGMAVCHTDGVRALLYMGVPFETLVGRELRAEVMRRVTSIMLPPPVTPDGDTDGDLDEDSGVEDGDWELDLDREVPPDGDLEYVDLELEDVNPGEDDKPDTPDGDIPDGDAPDGEAPDGDVPDGDTPDGDIPDGDAPDGDRTFPDGDTPSVDGDAPAECLPGYTRQGGMCVSEESEGGGGCRQTEDGAPGASYWLLGLLLAAMRRRRGDTPVQGGA